MKNIAILFTLLLLWGCNSSTEKSTTHDHSEGTEHEHAEKKEAEGKKKPLSPRTASMVNVGDNHVHIDYGSPSKRDRMIFGGLVGFGQVWATGAHKATYVNFGKDVTVGGVEIAAGKYGLFTIPAENEWTIIISKDWDMHLADDYNEANDIVRITAVPQQLEEVVESLTFEVNDLGEGKGTVTISWDTTAVSFNITNS